MASETVDPIDCTLTPIVYRAIIIERHLYGANERHQSEGLGREYNLVPPTHEASALPLWPLRTLNSTHIQTLGTQALKY